MQPFTERRIALQPEWDLIQRRIGELNASLDTQQFWCYQPWPDTDEQYVLVVTDLESETRRIALADDSMGLILDFLDIMLEDGVSEATLQATRERLLPFCAK